MLINLILSSYIKNVIKLPNSTTLYTVYLHFTCFITRITNRSIAIFFRFFIIFLENTNKTIVYTFFITISILRRLYTKISLCSFRFKKYTKLIKAVIDNFNARFGDFEKLDMILFISFSFKEDLNTQKTTEKYYFKLTVYFLRMRWSIYDVTSS